MADLGTIQTTNINAGTSTEDRSAEVRAVTQGLANAEDFIKQEVTRHATDEMEQALIEGIDASDPGSPSFEKVDQETMSVFADMSPAQRAEATELANTIRRAEASLQQADGSAQRTLAIHKLRNAQRDMKRKFGFVGSQIDSAANVLLTSSPEMIELQARTARSEAARAQTQDYIDRMAKEGYDDLKIPTRYTVGSVEFAYEYTKRSAWRQQQAQSEQQYAALAAAGQLNSVNKLRMFKERTLSSSSRLNTDILDPLRRDIEDSVTGLDAMRAGGLSESQMAQQWEKFVPLANAYQRKIMTFKTQLEQHFTDEWAGEDTESKEYKGAVAIKNSLIADLDMMGTMLEQGDVNIVDYLKTQQTIRAAGILDQVPSLRTLAALEAASPGLFNTIRALDVTHSSTGYLDLLGRGLTEDLNTAGIFQFGRLITDGSSTADAMEQARQTALMESPTGLGYTTSTAPRDKIAESWQALDTGMASFNVLARDVPSTFEAPGVFSGLTHDLAFNMANLYDWKVADRGKARKDTNYQGVGLQDSIQQTVDFLASDEYYKRYKALDPNDPNRAFMAKQLEEKFLKQDLGGTVAGLKPKEAWYTELAREGNVMVYGRPFIEYLELDIDKFHKEDRVVFRLNEDLLKVEAEKFVATGKERSGGGLVPAIKSVEITKALDAGRKRAANFSNNMTKYGRVVSMKDTVETDFMNAFYLQQDGTNLVDLFFPPQFPNTEAQ